MFDDNVRQIPVSNSKGEYQQYFLCSAEDYDELMKHAPWSKNPGGYAQSSKLGRGMSSFIMGKDIPPTHIIDHANRDTMDNRRSNLSIRTRLYNAQNRSKALGASSHFFGVSILKKTGKWQASVTINGETINLGCFVEEVDAAYERDAYLVQHPNWHEFGFPLNFPQRDYTNHVFTKMRNCPKRGRDTEKIRTEAKDIDETTVQLLVTGGHELLVDKESYEKLKRNRCYVQTDRSGYASAHVQIVNKSYRLGRYLTDVQDPTLIADHIDSNPLNCRMSNMRVVTRRQNSMNRQNGKRANRTSKFVGVGKRTGRPTYQSSIERGDKYVFRASHKSEEHVARKRDLFILDNRDEYFQKLNFSDWCPDFIAFWKAAK